METGVKCDRMESCMCRATCRKKKPCYKSAEDLAKEFHEANLFQKIKFEFVSDTEDMEEVYKSVQTAVNGCCLRDDEQLEQIEMVRAIYNGDITARPIGTSLGMCLSSLMVALFGIECALMAIFLSSSKDIPSNGIKEVFNQMMVFRDFIASLYVIMILVILIGLWKILNNTYYQKRSSVIVSAIDDTLKNAKKIKETDIRVCEQQNNENRDIC